MTSSENKCKTAEFKNEARQIIGKASLAFSQINWRACKEDPITVNDLHGFFHTLKGVFGVHGWKESAQLCSILDRFFKALYLDQIQPSDGLRDLLEQAIDSLSEMLKLNNKKEINFSTLTRCLEVKFKDELKPVDHGPLRGKVFSEANIPEPIINVLMEKEEYRLFVNLQANKGIFLITGTYSIEDFDIHFDPLREQIKEIGEVIAIVPSQDKVLADFIEFPILVCSPKKHEELCQKFSAENIKVTELKASFDEDAFPDDGIASGFE